MGLTVSIDGDRKKFETIEEMMQVGVLADIVDLGDVPNKFKPGTTQRKVRFVWIVTEEDSEGRQKRVFQRFTLSLHEKASLRKFLGQLGYKEFSATEPFDLEQLLGVSRVLILSKEDAENGDTFVNITANMPLGKNAPLAIPADFVRAKDKPAK